MVENNMKNFINNYIVRYIFVFLFVVIVGKIFPRINFTLENALGVICGFVLYDLIKYIYSRFRNRSTEISKN